MHVAKPYHILVHFTCRISLNVWKALTKCSSNLILDLSKHLLSSFCPVWEHTSYCLPARRVGLQNTQSGHNTTPVKQWEENQCLKDETKGGKNLRFPLFVQSPGSVCMSIETDQVERLFLCSERSQEIRDESKREAHVYMYMYSTSTGNYLLISRRFHPLFCLKW